MRHCRLPSSLALAAFLIGCGGVDGSDVSETHRSGLDQSELGQRRSAIVNGRLHSGHPAVGGLRYPGSSCSATLIGKQTVLTAAHCVQPGAVHTFELANRGWAVRKIVPHPKYTVGVIENDLAIVLLSEAPPVRPAAIAVQPPQLGQELTLVGLGQVAQDEDGSGFKRVATNTVAKMDEQRITYLSSGGALGNVCFGDSGGPSFATVNGQEVLVGVHSYIRGECGQEGNDMRVDVQRTWIAQSARGDVREGGFPDGLEPRVKITSPGAENEIYPRMTITVDAQDDVGLASVELLIDGAYRGQLSGPSYKAKVELGAGRHSIEVIATDYMGNSASDRITIEVVEFLPFGGFCDRNAQCETGLCGQHVALESGFCTARCDPTVANACPLDTECIADGGASFICGPASELLDAALPGCSVGSHSQVSNGLTILLFLALGFFFSRRR